MSVADDGLRERRKQQPLRVEQALRFLPDLEALAPLRALLLSASHPDERAQWASAGPYLTVGKRRVRPDEIRQRMTTLLERVSVHLGALYGAYVEALEHQHRGVLPEAVGALRRAGELERAVGRLAQAQAWYGVALGMAEGLQDRRPEIELLLALGDLGEALGRYNDAARFYQRGLALAEAEFDQAGAIAASEGLGNIALVQGAWNGAQAWYLRGMRLAEAASDPLPLGRLAYHLGELGRQRGDFTAAADHLARAHGVLEQAGDHAGLARVLVAQGRVHAAVERPTAAVGAFREALAWARRAPAEPGLETTVRVGLAELHLDLGRLLEAEEELRRAEQVAISQHLGARLVQIYTLFGRLRGLQGDETGFVFFEQAIELCRTFERAPIVEGQVYYDYGLFRAALGARDEARVYLERAREIFEFLGETARLERVRAELQQMTA